GINVPEMIRGRYSECSFFKTVIANPCQYKNFVLDDELLYLKKEDGQRVLAIPNCKMEGRSIREIIIGEAHTLLAHLGTRKTLDYLRDHVWWK
ncbi:hypothetical protein FA15DRAFT_553044, partial [Coprinopsis marcescibilis]